MVSRRTGQASQNSRNGRLKTYSSETVAKKRCCNKTCRVISSTKTDITASQESISSNDIGALESTPAVEGGTAQSSSKLPGSIYETNGLMVFIFNMVSLHHRLYWQIIRFRYQLSWNDIYSTGDIKPVLFALVSHETYATYQDICHSWPKHTCVTYLVKTDSAVPIPTYNTEKQSILDADAAVTCSHKFWNLLAFTSYCNL